MFIRLFRVFGILTTPFDLVVPAAATTYCQTLWQTYQFVFNVSRPRRTRLGDFRVLPNGQTQITVNADLSPEAFLITYVHEVAHAHVHKYAKRRVAPHGPAWQKAFQQLMQPLLHEGVFPMPILQPLQLYLQKPAATTAGYVPLMLALQQQQAGPETQMPANRMRLSDLAEGAPFLFNKKTFVRRTLRRTRVVCKEVSTGRLYAILAHAWVETI